jgi:hypothetical protein
MRATYDLRVEEMSIDELTSELRRVRGREGREDMGGWKRRYEDRESEVTKELFNKNKRMVVSR